MATITLKGYSVMLDDEDVSAVMAKTWQVKKNNGRIYFRHHYKIIGAKKYKSFSLHHFIFGVPPIGYVVDHIDNNSLNNRKCNLRYCTFAQNAWNRKRESLNTSGYKGVTYFAKTDKWRAVIRVHGKLISLGLYFTKLGAYKAYCAASKKYHGEYGRTK